MLINIWEKWNQTLTCECLDLWGWLVYLKLWFNWIISNQLIFPVGKWWRNNIYSIVVLWSHLNLNPAVNNFTVILCLIFCKTPSSVRLRVFTFHVNERIYLKVKSLKPSLKSIYLACITLVPWVLILLVIPSPKLNSSWILQLPCILRLIYI